MKTTTKNAILIIIPIVLIMAIAIIEVVYPSVDVFWFTTKHILIYMLFTYFVMLIGISIYNSIIQNNEISNTKLYVSRILTGVLITVLVLGGGSLQLTYVNDYLIPPLGNCSFYDRNYNLIYASSFNYVCPEMNNVDYAIKEDGLQTLTFDVVETATGVRDVSHDDNYYYTTNSIVNTSVYIEYSGNNISKAEIVAEMKTKSAPNKETFNEFTTETVYTTWRYKKIVENTFLEEAEDTDIYEIKTTITEYETNSVTLEEYEKPLHFTGATKTITTYTATHTRIDNEKDSIPYDYDVLFERTIDDEETISTVVWGAGTRTNAYYELDLVKDHEFGDYVTLIEYKNIAYGTFEEYTVDNPTYEYIDSPYYNDEPVTGEFSYYTVLNSSGKPKLSILENYTRLVDNHEVGLDVKVENYQNKYGDFYINHLDTVKISKNDGNIWLYSKAEHYYTYQLFQGEPLRVYNNGDVYGGYSPDTNNFVANHKTLFDPYNSIMNYASKERIIYHQRNPLLIGFETLWGVATE